MQIQSRALCGSAALILVFTALVGLRGSLVHRASSVELLASTARSTRRPLGPAQDYIQEARHTSYAAVKGPGVLAGLKEERQNVSNCCEQECSFFPAISCLCFVAVPWTLNP